MARSRKTARIASQVPWQGMARQSVAGRTNTLQTAEFHSGLRTRIVRNFGRFGVCVNAEALRTLCEYVDELVCLRIVDLILRGLNRYQVRYSFLRVVASLCGFHPQSLSVRQNAENIQLLLLFEEHD